jgi:galactose mutarotase-like enzyme
MNHERYIFENSYIYFKKCFTFTLRTLTLLPIKMTSLRRDKTAGASYFFTVNVLDRKSGLLTKYIEALREAHQHVMKRHPFCLEAMVVLPDHLHALWTLPPCEDALPLEWGSCMDEGDFGE